MPKYLESLTLRLAAGLAHVDERCRERHARWLLRQQRADGGFAGRDGGSDLYYTSFALRSLAILGELHGSVAERIGEFLSRRLAARETIIDFLSLIYSGVLLDASAGIDIFASAAEDWRLAVAAAWDRLRRADGGYAKGPEGQASSTYHSFLVLLCLDLLEIPPPDPESLAAFILSQRCPDGGFREIRASKRAGTNPTAAAIGVLRLLDRLTDEIRDETIDFLADMQMEDGGLRANTRIPIADLLSTFTGLWTLDDLDGAAALDLEALRRFALSLEEETGGFRAAEWDQLADVEYTFYGLGTLALLAAIAERYHGNG